MEWYNTMQEMFEAKISVCQKRYFCMTEGYFVAESWIALQMVSDGESVAELTMVKAELAQDWGILRTGGVASTFRGTEQAAREHVRYLNATDEQGSTEIVTNGMTPAESLNWLIEVAR